MQRIFRGSLAHSARSNAPVQETTLWKLTTECSSALKKLQVDQRLPEKIGALKSTYAIDLRLEAEEAYKQMDVHAVDDSPEALAMALAWDLSHFLDWTPNFLRDYSVRTPQMALSVAITPIHQQYLMKSFRKTFDALPREDRIKLVIAIDSEALNALECRLTPEEKRLQVTARYAMNQINLDELLSLVDYTHVSTSQFVPINCALRLARYASTQVAADIVSCVSQPMLSALTTLMRNPDFICHGDLYKGVYLLNPAGPYRKSCLMNGKIFQLAHPTSTTSDPDQSYANPPTMSFTEPRDTNLIFKNASGVRVHLFNDLSTTSQKEVLLMPTMALKGIPEPVNASDAARHARKQTFYCELDPEASGYAL